MLNAEFKDTDFPEIKDKEARKAAKSLYNFYFELAIHMSPPFNQDKAKLAQMKKMDDVFVPQAIEMGLNLDQIDRIRTLAFERLVDYVNKQMAVLNKQDGKKRDTVSRFGDRGPFEAEKLGRNIPDRR